ncbi:MAG TPA: Ig-like domain-containing protein [Gammaproteobacteria bacterium]
MNKNSLLSALLFLVIGISLAGCGLDNDKTGSPPQNEPPLSNQPPAAEPPAEEPSVEEPPATNLPPQPPVTTPPVEEPPVDEEPPTDVVGTLTLDEEILRSGIAPIGSIALHSNRPLDASSVETSIELRDADTTETVAASVTYEATEQRVVIVPAKKLEEGKRYAVHVQGAADMEGNAVEIAGHPVARVKQRVYSRTTLYNDDGTAPRYVSHYSRVPGSDQALKISYGGPGPDGVWGEGQDDVRRYERTAYFPDSSEEVFIYDGPGDDGVWFEGEDHFERAWRYRYTPDGRVTERLQTLNAGVDGDFFTADDHYMVAEFRVYNALGQLTLSLYRSVSYPEEMRLNPGIDEEWLTGDDGVFIYDRYEYDLEGRLSRELTFSTSAGGPNDGVAFSDDDRLLNYTTYLYDEQGQVRETHTYYGPGSDNTWLNDNDEAGSFYRFVRTDSAFIKEFWDAGPDSQVNTGDDWLRDYHLREYDAQGRPIRTGTYEWKGPDGDWHTPDDEPFSWADVYAYGFDEHGRPQMKVFSLEDNGPDSNRFSGDEEIVAKWVRSYDDTSQLTHAQLYFDAGLLPGWENGDEVLSSETEYLEIEE